MAYITFITRKRAVASFALRDECILGRSLDCDVFVPDMFVSRTHCRFRKTPDGWMVMDLSSRNGLYYRGRRVSTRLLQPGDVIEVGTIGFRFGEDLPNDGSNPTPFGENFPLLELVDTVFAESVHPSEFTKGKRRLPAWKRRDLVALEEVEPLPLESLAARDDGDWTELDLELQIAEEAAEMRPAFVLLPAEGVPVPAPSAVAAIKPKTMWAKGTNAKAIEIEKPILRLSRPGLGERFMDHWQELRKLDLPDVMRKATENKLKLVAIAASVALLWISTSWVSTRLEIRRERNTPLTLNDRVARGN